MQCYLVLESSAYEPEEVDRLKAHYLQYERVCKLCFQSTLSMLTLDVYMHKAYPKSLIPTLGSNQAALPLRSQLLLLKVDALHLSLSSRQHLLCCPGFPPLGLILLTKDGNLLLLGAHLLVQVVDQQVLILLPLLKLLH